MNGIKGPNPFINLEGFDFSRAFVPDYMHALCLGVVKTMIDHWTRKKRSKENWYIGDKMDVIKARLSKIKPPYEITRTPGQFDDLSNWKASEFRAFFLYYFTILKDILPLDYFLHFSRLSYASFILMQGEIPRVHVENAGKILQQFVVDMESLYGIERITSNFHLLTHLAESVLKWGCLWTTSTFIPEWFNGELISLANGTQAVVDQMAFNYLMRCAIRDEALSLLDAISIPREISVLFEELLNIKTKTTASNNKGIGSGTFFCWGLHTNTIFL